MNAPHTRKSLVKGERFIRYVWKAWVSGDWYISFLRQRNCFTKAEWNLFDVKNTRIDHKEIEKSSFLHPACQHIKLFLLFFFVAKSSNNFLPSSRQMMNYIIEFCIKIMNRIDFHYQGSKFRGLQRFISIKRHVKIKLLFNRFSVQHSP